MLAYQFSRQYISRAIWTMPSCFKMKEAGKWKPILFACFIFAYATNPKILILSLTATPKEVESALRQTSILMMICLASLSMWHKLSILRHNILWPLRSDRLSWFSWRKLHSAGTFLHHKLKYHLTKCRKSIYAFIWLTKFSLAFDFIYSPHLSCGWKRRQSFVCKFSAMVAFISWPPELHSCRRGLTESHLYLLDDDDTASVG